MTTEPHVYGDYMRDRTGWFFGLTGAQLALVTLAGFPVWLTVNGAAWAWLALWVPTWGLVVVLTVVPVRGWTAAQWIVVVARHAWSLRHGWNTWRARIVTHHVSDVEVLDLPGTLSQLVVHDGLPFPATQRPVALVENRTARTWAATARVEHPGIGLTEASTRNRYGAGLSELLETAARTELVDLVALHVRTIPDDGAEREHWVGQHRSDDAPALARRVNKQLETQLLPAAVRTEAFVTVVVSESRLPREARGRRAEETRVAVIHGVMREVEARLLGAMGCAQVEWLDKAGFAVAVRTGFDPGHRSVLKAAELARSTNPRVQDAVPLAACGPTSTSAQFRRYDHGPWSSVSATIVLPDQGALLGSMAPLLTPSAPGERRSLTAYFAPIAQRTADRLTSREEMSALTGAELRRRSGRLERAKDRRAAARVRSNDEKLARGRALIRPSAIATTTVPVEWSTDEYGRRLEASIRLAGFASIRLDGAHDAALQTSIVPAAARV